jgi:glycosyltransferase involved in cell wall biosynthesis
LPEAAGDAGLLLPPLDVEAWTAALRRARSDADWRTETARRGLDHARRFTWMETARQTILSYERSLSI